MEKIPALDCIYEAFNAITTGEKNSVNKSLVLMSYKELNDFVKQCARAIGKKAIGFIDPKDIVIR